MNKKSHNTTVMVTINKGELSSSTLRTIMEIFRSPIKIVIGKWDESNPHNLCYSPYDLLQSIRIMVYGKNIGIRVIKIDFLRLVIKYRYS